MVLILFPFTASETFINWCWNCFYEALISSAILPEASSPLTKGVLKEARKEFSKVLGGWFFADFIRQLLAALGNSKVGHQQLSESFKPIGFELENKRAFHEYQPISKLIFHRNAKSLIAYKVNNANLTKHLHTKCRFKELVILKISNLWV
jgi:hypothetical protein